MQKLLCKLGFHKWELKKETSRLAANIRTYKCVHCPKTKGTYQRWGSEKELKLK